MGLTYQSLHWGDEPAGFDLDLSVFAEGSSDVVEEIRQLAYAARKGGKSAIWEHPFTRRYDDQEDRERGPYLLEAARRGGEFLVDEFVDEDGRCLGLGVELECADEDDPIALAECMVVTNAEGRYCQIAFVSRAPWCLEQTGQIVTNDGIEG